MATKSSVLVFYLRLAGSTQKIMRMTSWAVLGVVNTAGIILTFMNIFQCTPINAAWDIRVQPTRCIPLLTEFICSAPVNVTTDLAILALPIPVLTSMHLPQRQKTILVFTFALGIFVTIVDVVRIYYLQHAIAYVPMTPSSDPMAMFGQSAGFSWNASFSLMWSAVEVNVGITCACIPTLKPLIIRILPAMLLDPNGTRRTASQILDDFNAIGGTKPNSLDNSHPPTGSTLVADSPISHPPPSFIITPPEGRPSEEISIRNFLSGDPAAPDRRVSTYSSRETTILPSHRNSANMSIHFGFVNMKKPKSMLKTSASESFKYCTIVSILFFLWGFSYGLLNTLNNVVAQVANMSTAQTLGLSSLYFGGGYFLGPLLVGEWLLRHDEHHRTKKSPNNAIESVGGFKATFIVGLLIYGTGTIMFWPGAVLSAYGGFMVSSFVVGFGVAVLETAANPFLILCGPPEYADTRLLLAQGVQAVGSVLSGLLANNVFFATLESREKADSTTLVDVQWTYLGVTLLSVLLALYFYYMPLPEVSDRELAELSSRLPADPKTSSPFPKRFPKLSLRNYTIILAVLAQWTYISAQENMSIFFQPLITSFSADPSSSQPPGFGISVANYLVVAHTLFGTSRFLAAIFTFFSATYPTIKYLPTPRTILLFTVSASTLCALVTIVLPPTSNDPNVLAIPILLFFFFEGPIFPLVYSLGLKGQGDRTKRAAAWLTMGGCGPAFWPFVTYAITERGGGSIRRGSIVAVILMGVTIVYPLGVSLVKEAREMADYVLRGGDETTSEEEERNTGFYESGDEKGTQRGMAMMKKRFGQIMGSVQLPRRAMMHLHGGGGGGKNKNKEKRNRMGPGDTSATAAVGYFESRERDHEERGGKKTRKGKGKGNNNNEGLVRPPVRRTENDHDAAERGTSAAMGGDHHRARHHHHHHHHITPPWEREGLELDTRILRD